MASYPRVYVSEKTLARVKRIAKKQNVSVKSISDKIVVAGIRALEL